MKFTKRTNEKRLFNIVYAILGLTSIMGTLIFSIMYFYYNKYSELTNQVYELFKKTGFNDTQVDNATKSMMIENGVSIYGIEKIEIYMIIAGTIAIVAFITLLTIVIIRKIRVKRGKRE